MKKILTMLIAVAVLFSAVPLAKAGNPPVNTNNPFLPPGYNLSVVKVNNPYMAGFDSYWPTYTCPDPFVVQDGDCAWFFAEKYKKEANGKYSPHYEIAKMNTKTGIVEDSYQIEGSLRYWTSILQDDYNYYIMSAVYKKDSKGKKPLKSILYAFSKKTKHVVWKQEFSDTDLTPGVETGIFCAINNGVLFIRDYHLGKLMYLDHNGNKIWEKKIMFTSPDEIGIVGYNSKKKSVIVEVNGAQHIYEVSIENGKATESTLKVEGNFINSDKIFWYGPFGPNLQDIAKGSILMYVGEKNIFPYTILAYLKYDEKNDEYILKEFKILNPTPLENTWFQSLCAPWFYHIIPLNNDRYLYYDLPRFPYHDTSMYAIMYNEDFSKKIWTIRVGKTKVNLNGKTVTYIPMNTFRIYDMPEYGRTLIYADKNKIVFADSDTAVPKAKFTLPAPHLTAKEGQTLREFVMPLGVSNRNLYVTLIEMIMDGKTGKAVKVETYIAKFSCEEAHLTVNSSIPGLRFTISKDGKKYVVEEGKKVSLIPGTYTIMPMHQYENGMEAPKPATITLKDGDNKVLTMNYKDVTPPVIEVTSVKQSKFTLGFGSFTVKGTVKDNYSGVSQVEVNGKDPDYFKSETGEWSITLTVHQRGDYPVAIKASDKVGNVSVKQINVHYAPAIVLKFRPNNKQFYVDGEIRVLDSPPVIIPKWGRTVVPIRAIVEALGGTIGWDPVQRMVTINLGDNTINLWIGKPQAEVNGVMKWIDENNHNVKPIIINFRTMLPLRFVAESLGCSVDWDPATKTITITYTSSQ